MNPDGSRRGSRRGVAILVVLAVTALLTVLIVSLFDMGKAADVTADSQVDTIRVEMLRDTAFNLVLAQLRSATTQELAPGVPAPWASQPGAVHVHGMDGRVKEIRRLYSAENPVAESAEELDGDLVEQWRSPAGKYADLNAPVAARDGGIRFPIADPRLAAGEPGERAEGFAVLPDGAPDGTKADRTDDAARLPMPVLYLYFLADGTMGYLSDSGMFRNLSGDGVPSRKNPISGRIAYWTDDESAKINVNTAGEAAPWDTPRLTTEQDRALAGNQPMRGEFHRYPGHPAGVSLSSVMFPGKAWHLPGDPHSAVFEKLTHEEAMSLWEASPGLRFDPLDSSDGGWRQPKGLDRPADQASATPWHLYPSPAEFALNDARRIRSRLRPFPGAVTRLARADFLLTAHSRAPEMTLFGTPRVSMWPVHPGVIPGEPVGDGPVVRASGYDSMMALVSSAGGRKWYIQRAVPGNGSEDFRTTAAGANARLFDSLMALLERPVPGFARDGLPASFAEKYGGGPDGDAANLLALAFDYIRTTNLADSNLPEANQFSIVCPGNPVEGYGQISPLNTARGNSGESRWKPEQRHAARGLGRIPTISEAAIVFVCRAQRLADGTMTGLPSSKEAEDAMEPGARELEAALFFEGFVPGQGWAESRPWCTLVVAGVTPDDPTDFSSALPPMDVNGASLAPRSFAYLTKLRGEFAGRNRVPASWPGAGGNAGVRSLMSGIAMFEPVVVHAASGEALQFSGTGEGGIKTGILDTPSIANPARRRLPLENLVQVIELHFPAIAGADVPLPTLPADGLAPDLENRIRRSFKDGLPLLSAQDVVQSLVPVHGDARVLAGRRMVGRDESGVVPEFVAHPEYGRMASANSLLERPAGVPEAAASGYFEDIELPVGSAPDYPVAARDGVALAGSGSGDTRAALRRSVSDAVAAVRLDGGRRGPATPDLTGDFDAAAGRAPDGPYVNRPDDGEVRGIAAGRMPYFDPPDVDAYSIPPSSAAASSPNRLVPGPGMFGSLPTGVVARVPWQTLLFRPWMDGSDDPEKWTTASHYGWSWPRDHLFLDLFWMPVIEPWGISTPFETAGKINLNQGIVPFRHIRRETALHALLKSERLIAIDDRDAAAVRKSEGFSSAVARRFIDADATLDLWRSMEDERGRLFLTASEVCELPLLPEGVAPTREAIAKWWEDRRTTGDNLKERPYANLHARLTARSNVYRVHVVAESLQPRTSGDPAHWVEGEDRVVARWRGSALVERHLRADDYPAEADTAGADAATVPPAGELYQWRVSHLLRSTDP